MTNFEGIVRIPWGALSVNKHELKFTPDNIDFNMNWSMNLQQAEKTFESLLATIKLAREL